jgi:hypothetical protein
MENRKEERKQYEGIQTLQEQWGDGWWLSGCIVRRKKGKENKHNQFLLPT